jgi:hypothetical protein
VLNIQVAVHSVPCMSNIIIIDDLELLPAVYVVYFCGYLRRAVHDEYVFQPSSITQTILQSIPATLMPWQSSRFAMENGPGYRG